MVKIFICGDIVNYNNLDGIVCSESMSQIISSTDYSICNFEAPIEGSGEKAPKSGVHHFQRKSTIIGLRKQGFDLLCLANNHIMDYGKLGLLSTIEEARNNDFDTLGAGENFKDAYRPIIKRFNNVKVGFVNACEAQFGVIDYHSSNQQPGYAWINHNELDKQIINLKKNCDFVVVLAHAGLENYNIPQKEWRWRYKHFCDIGADIVVASHPHVPQGFENYNDSIIFYSLGNFYFDSKNFKMKEDRSYSIILDLEKKSKIKFKPVYHHKQDGKVQLSPVSKQIDLKSLNDNLCENYNKLHDEMSLKIYNKMIRRNLIFSLNPYTFDGKLLSSLKMKINLLIGRRKKTDKNLLALHLLRNEAYYYAAKHALELNSLEKNDRR